MTKFLDDIEDERVKQVKEKNCTELVEILVYDVVDLYPSLRLEFVMREIDRVMVLRIQRRREQRK